MRALEANPTLWTAYEKLGKLGEHTVAVKVFNENKYKNYEQNGKKPSTPMSLRKKKDENLDKNKRTSQSITQNQVKRRGSVSG